VQLANLAVRHGRHGARHQAIAEGFDGPRYIDHTPIARKTGRSIKTAKPSAG
jgi:hypothetical protein